MAEGSTADFALLFIRRDDSSCAVCRMRESRAEFDSFKSQLCEESRFSIGDSALCGHGLGRLSWRHQFGSHAPGTAVDARQHSLDHCADSVRADALAMRNTWNSLVPFGAWCVHQGSVQVTGIVTTIYLFISQCFSAALRGASEFWILPRAEPPDLRN